MRKYKGIDIGRLIFACLIPLLHIGMTDPVSFAVMQYISRLGVPFFFAVAGMFLSRSIEKNGGVEALKKYAMKIGRMLLIWLAIYLPILMRRQGGVTIQEILFKTPAYLWYLTALLAAAVPFCLIKDRNSLYIVSAFLFVIGTVFGDTYRWLVGGVQRYEQIFLTTRNGIFFGLPLMCVGDLTWKKEKASIPGLIISGSLLAAEITFVGMHADPSDDRSMYLMLPLFIFYLILILREWNPKVDNSYMGGISTAIYVMQFGLITVALKAAGFVGVSSTIAQWIAWIMVIIIPTGLYLVFRKTRVSKILF